MTRKTIAFYKEENAELLKQLHATDDKLRKYKAVKGLTKSMNDTMVARRRIVELEQQVKNLQDKNN